MTSLHGAGSCFGWRNVFAGVVVLVCAAALQACGAAPIAEKTPGLGTEGPIDAEMVPTEGVRMIPVETPRGTFEVWTQKLGDNPAIKVLLLHGGPGVTHEYLEGLAEGLEAAGFEVYLYDQLGSYFSDQPDDPDLWETARFVDEVEQVRMALGLGPDNFVLYGHSWGGILAIEYALAHGNNLKGLVISDMMASIPLYNRYAEEVLMPQMDQEALAEIKALEAAGDFENPRYTELLMNHFYVNHILRRPPDEWPDAVNRTFEHINPNVYVLMQGPSELGAGGRLLSWDRTADLGRITVPTLVIGARYDTMDPDHMAWMAEQFPNGQYLYCANGSHLAMFDDEQVYLDGLVRFFQEIDDDG